MAEELNMHFSSVSTREGGSEGGSEGGRGEGRRGGREGRTEGGREGGMEGTRAKPGNHLVSIVNIHQ